MTAPEPTSDSTRRPAPGGGAILWWLLVLLLAAGGWFGWQQWQAQRADAQAEQAHDAQRLAALEARMEALRRDQRANAARLQHADATNRLLREELLGLGQRAGLLEDSVAKLAESGREGVQALRLDEVEMLLGIAGQRLALASDLEGARQAYASAADVLDDMDDPGYLNLRQVLAQERAALAGLGSDPRARATAQLAAVEAALGTLPERTPAPATSEGSWWERLLGRVVATAPSDPSRIAAPAERQAGLLAMQVELSLARAALERRDAVAFRGALARIDGWLARLWPDSQALRQQRATLDRLRGLALTIDLPVLGSTLEQLRRLRTAR